MKNKSIKSKKMQSKKTIIVQGDTLEKKERKGPDI